MNAKTLPKILTALLVFAALPACSTAPSSTASSQPSAVSSETVAPGTSQALGDLGTIGYTVDSGRKVSGTFDINDAKPLTLVADDANGYSWMLWIPADALMSTQTVTMTPFSTIDTSQSEAKIISGVRLEPDGIQFMNAVQLKVHPPEKDPGVGLIFSFNQDGSNVAFAPTTNTSGGKTAIAQIWHFSAAGYDNGYDAGRDGIDQYQKMAREEYRLALDAARQFIKNGAPRPPTSPSISMFCRGTEHNPEQNEAYEYMREFLDPYSDYVVVLLAAIKNIQLLGVEDVDTTAGTDAIITILQMAEKTLLELGNQYQKDKPPDRLIAAIDTGLQIDRQIQMINGDTPLLLFPEKISSWASTVRDYYLNELKTKHDYRAFPTILTLEKWVQLVGGPDRFAEILSAMTFEVILDTSFNGTWKTSTDVIATGNVVQTADVKDLKMMFAQEEEGLWGDLDNMQLRAKSGTYKSLKETVQFSGMTDTGVLWLKNWDPCVTKSFDVLIGGFLGKGTDASPGMVAAPASMVSFEQYYWEVATAFIFTIPITNLDANMGEQTFSGSGSGAEGQFTGSGKIHIVLKHTPK
ncbi:MAG: hypothetical protein ABSA10_00705 [Anaerolineales bacterium]|jgi:hypothetical protein